ncbi:ArsA family ATPase [Streptomyces corynorhini]|uniref:ArsA family ATPase n=1 Tax=Streptomyces corynorhini TaxID=2282652 RepID=A0A370BB44_9ACTN|nr:ArsA family ATPase [Streptomyces corynorhini]RDG36645.1 ArsA family ATPase [Streptomyces corynorhini]
MTARHDHAPGDGSRTGGLPTALDSTAAPLDVDPLLDDPETRIIVCCGSGGVGKTTTAAALGVRAAERGRKAVVLTIDPARRLAQSMGIDELGNTPRQVKGVEGPGELHAMMLDMKRTFDEVVEAHTDKERARSILANPFYQSLSAGFAGTQEYMAMEKLGQLRARDEWDLIIVDTPPSRSALDFLDAPKRLGSFLDGKFIRLLMAPAKVGGRAGMKFLNVGMSMMTGTLGKLLGGQFLRDVQTFVTAMDTMFGGFRTRADATYRLLQAPGTAFLVVAAPERDALREAAYFVERLAAEEMPLAGLVLNRVHGSGAARLSAERARAAAENLEEGRIVDQAAGKAEGSGTAAPVGSSPEAAEAHEPVDPVDVDPVDIASEEAAPEEAATDDIAAEDAVAEAGESAADPGGSGTAESHRTQSPTPDSSGPAGPPVPPGPSGRSGTSGVRDQSDTPEVPGSSASTPSAEPTEATASVTSVEQLTAGLLRLHTERMQVLARERRTRDRFTALHPEVAVVEVAALPGDVHDLAGLRAIGARLAAGRTAE